MSEKGETPNAKASTRDNLAAWHFGRSLLSAACFVALMWDVFQALYLAPILMWFMFSLDWDPFSGMTVWVPISIAVIVAALIQVYVLERLPRQRVWIAFLLFALAVVLPYTSMVLVDYALFGPRPIF